MAKKLSFALLILITFISLLLVKYQSKGQLSFPRVNFAEILSPITYSKNFVKDIFSLREENERLKKQIFEISLQQKSYHTLIDENLRLKQLLSLKEHRKDIVAIGTVISKGNSRFLKTLWIDKGQNQGVKKGYAAITPNGLIGKVLSVQSDYSEILLITDPNFSVAVRIDRTQVEGVLSGRGDICILKYVPLEEEILVGDRIVTSGLDGVFPEGILVGAVKSVDKRKGLFQYIEVVPLQPENKIREVAIIKKT